MPYATATDGVTLWFRDDGEGEPIVFVHEFGGEPASWTKQIAALSSDYRCIAYAARGFHPSDIPSDLASYGQHRATSDLLAVLDHLRIDRAHLVGTSMGSFTSLDFTLEHGERVASLTLVGNSSGPRTEAESHRYREHWVREEITLREESGARGAVAALEKDPAYQTFQKKLPSDWSDYAERLAAQSVQGALNILKTLHWDRRSLWADEIRLQQIPCPVLLIHGEEDYFLVAATNDYLAEVVPGAQRVCFAATGHLANIEQAERFNTLLRAHLEGATGG